MPQPPSRSSRNPPLTLLETTAHLREYFGNAVFSRGMGIRLNEPAIKRLAVEQLEDDEWHVQGDIVGTAPEPYRADVYLDIDPPTRRLEILSTACTCPVEFDCKHAAGLLLKWFSLFPVDADGVFLDIAETKRKPTALGEELDFADDDSDADHDSDESDKRAPRRKKTDAAPTHAVRTMPVAMSVAEWLEETFSLEALPTATKAKPPATREALIFYVLADDASLHAVRGRRRRDGSEPELTGDYAGTAWLDSDRALPSYARPADKALLTLMVSEQNFALGSVAVALIGESGALLIELARATGRLYGMSRQTLAKALTKSKAATIVTQYRQLPPPLIFNALEAASLGWRITDREALKPLRLTATVKGQQVAIIATAPPMAFDLAANCIFPVSVSVSGTTLQRLASLPAIRSDDTTSWAFVRDAIAALPDADSVPPLPFADDVAVPLPKAVLSFALIEYQTTTGWGKHAHTDTHTVPTAQLLFDYNGRRRPADRMGLNAAVEAELINNRLAGTHLRNVRAEREWARRMPIALVPAAQVDYRIAQAALDGSATAPSLWALKDHDWTERGATVLADAQSAGFEIEIDAAFPLSLEDIPTPELALSPGQQNGWYRIALGVTINGEPVDLAPALARLIGAQKDPEAWLAAVADIPTVLLSVAHKKSKGGAVVVRLPGERVHALLTPVFDWFRGGALSPMSGLQAAMLPDLPATAVRYLGRDDPRWLAMRTAITDGAQLVAMRPAAGFEAALRPYQLHGLSWLQHLYKIGMSGVLADDMGLGKTVQTLAFLHARRNAAPMATNLRPSLIIAPTSVTVNWLAEIRRFTPTLKVVTHYGAERALTDETLAGADLVLTSYPILQRDDARFAQCEWDVVVFDEAQMIKNAKA
ncbi:MAG: SNF2-related protein, partial [Betaproteobacteria bacterium]